MRVKCSKCGCVYKIDASKIPDKGAHAKCRKCQNRIFINKHAENLKNKSVPPPLPSHVNTSNRNNTQKAKPERMAEVSRNVVCPKCGQRQPLSRDKCFKCGYDFEKLKAGQGGQPAIPAKKIFGIPGHWLKDSRILIPSVITVGLLFFLGLYYVIFPSIPKLGQILRIPGTVVPIAVNADSFTSIQFNEQRKVWFYQCYLEDYKKYAKHSVAWDSKVKNVFDKYATYGLGLSDDFFCSELLEDIQEIVDLGCNDARMTYMLGNLTYRVYGAKYAEIPIEKSFNGLEQGDYPDFYRYFAARRLILIYEKLGYEDEEVYDLLYEKKMKYLARAAADDRFKNGNQRYYLARYFFEFKRDSELPRQIEKFMEEYEKLENVDPWIDAMVRGRYHYGLGWVARGGGYAKTVTEEGWKIFKSELSDARDYYTSAHQMHPEFPEAASQMISIRMSSAGFKSEREWFNLAVKAQFDYMPAYKNFLWSIRPRWGGSHKEMLAFGIACLNTERYDTDVPGIFLKSIRDISTEYKTRQWTQPFREAGIYKKVQKYFEGILNEPSRESKYYRNKSSYVLYAWLCGEYKDAKEMMVELGENFIPEVSEEVNVKPHKFVNHLSSM